MAQSMLNIKIDSKDKECFKIMEKLKNAIEDANAGRNMHEHELIEED